MLADRPAHLTYVLSDRGFKRLPSIPSAYPGGHVEVYESSAASGPHVWLAATAPLNLNEPDGPKSTSPIHLTAESAWHLSEQLRLLVERHYQGDARPRTFADGHTGGGDCCTYGCPEVSDAG